MKQVFDTSAAVLRRKKITPITLSKIAGFKQSNIHRSHPLYGAFEAHSIETIKRIVYFWRHGDSIKVMGEKAHMSADSVREIVNAIMVLQETGGRAHSTVRPENLTRSGVRHCIRCRYDFWSPDKRQIHTCDPCNTSETDIVNHGFGIGQIHSRLF
ncbi:MAG: hypothetical protein AAB727_03330 [Patescibacteria group bacterium]